MSYRKKHIHPKIKRLKPKKRFWQHRIFWFALFFTLMLSIATYFIFFLPQLQIENIQISGNRKITTAQIDNIAYKQIKKNLFPAGLLTLTSESIIIENTSKLEELIADAFVLVKDVHVHKAWPQGITIEIVEREPFAVFCFGLGGSECFYIDDTGIIFEKVVALEENLPTLYESGDMNLVLGSLVTKPNLIAATKAVGNALKENFGIGIMEVAVSNPLIITTSEGWKLYLDPDGDIDMQVTKMNAMLEGEISLNQRQQMKYLYLQYKDRAYYK